MDKLSEGLEWWGYRHINGSFHVKRYFFDPGDLDEAMESPFVKAVTTPFPATSRSEAIRIVTQRLG